MRLPGCLRRQPRGKARRVEIINNTGLRYSAEQLDELLPELPPEPPRSQRRSGGRGRSSTGARSVGAEAEAIAISGVRKRVR